MRPLLTNWLCLATCLNTAPASKPQQLTIHNQPLFEKLTANLDASKLLYLYQADLKVQQVSRNRHEPAIKDSILAVSTPADQLKLFKNRYNTLLLGATFTSPKISFAGLRVGVDKMTFCRKLHLKPTYTCYAFTDGQENFVQMKFTFLADRLQKVEYQQLQSLYAID